jgi:hypothetical protein
MEENSQKMEENTQNATVCVEKIITSLKFEKIGENVGSNTTG